jgi:hypothetical protein
MESAGFSQNKNWDRREKSSISLSWLLSQKDSTGGPEDGVSLPEDFLARLRVRLSLVVHGLSNAKLLLHVLERDTLSFRVNKEDHEELQHHHGGKEYEWIGAGRGSHERKGPRDKRVHEPV